MRFESSDATGGIIEQELFGKSLYEKNNEEFEGSHYKYLPRKVALDILKDMQPFDDPTDPEPEYINTVHALIFEKLGIDAQDVKFFTAVKSPLDIFHGVDGWFEIVGGNGNLVIVTIDITANPKKGDEHKADIVFLVPKGGLDRKVDKEQFIRYSESLADEVVEFFEEKMKGKYGQRKTVGLN